MNWNEAVRIICSRCKVGKTYCRGCPVTRTALEYEAEEYAWDQLELIKHMTISKTNGWFTGIIGGFYFQALVFKDGSKYGINKGRVSKLYIMEQPKNANRGREILVSYDRGWDKVANTKETQLVLDTLVEYFENLPANEIN